MIVALGTGMGFLWKVSADQQAYNKFEHRGLPIIEINLNGVSVGEINSGAKDTKYEGNELLLYDNSKITDFKDVEVKGRGNGTWAQGKKPYQIEFSRKVDLFGMGKAKKWLLLADYMDDTHVRNDLAFEIERMLDMEYTFDGKYVEVYFNGDYYGLYYLTHAVEIGKNTVDLKDSLGVLVELDNYYGMVEEYYKTKDGDLLVVKDVVNKDKKDLAMEAFLDAFNELEEAVEDGNFDSVKKVIDAESFAKYYILSEFSVNPDAYWTSLYFYKDGQEDLIHAGPGWDFDLAFSNRYWGNWLGERFYSPYETMIRKQELLPKEFFDENEIEDGYENSLLISKLFFNLMEMPEFKEEVEAIFKERLSGRENELINYISERSKLISKANQADGERWNREYINEKTDELKDWVGKRYQYFESVYGNGLIVDRFK